MKDPTSSISDKPKKARASHKNNPSRAPTFTSTDYLDVESNSIPSFHNQAENEYMERIKLRAKVQALAPDSVPAPSDFEAQLLVVQRELNVMYKTSVDGNHDTVAAVKARSNLEILYSRFGTRSLFNIASSIATSRLQKQSIREYEALVNDPSEAVSVILGANSEENTRWRVMQAKQEMASRTWATSKPRVSIGGGSGLPPGGGGSSPK